jgi:putative salt-induced outer membrane protein
MRLGPLLVLLGLTAVPALARAQTPDYVRKKDAATKGATDVGKGGFEAAPADDLKNEEIKNYTEAKVNFGALVAAGNSKSLAITGGATLATRFIDSNLLAFAIAGNYARAGKTGEGMQQSVENFQGKARYDRFFTPDFTGFTAVTARYDRFQGLDLRLNVDPGFAYYLVNDKKQSLRLELGYDFQFDVRRQETIDKSAAAGDCTTKPGACHKTAGRHHIRSFVGYTVALNENVSLDTGFEYLQGIASSTDDNPAKNVRLNYDLGINAKLVQRLAIALTFNFKYDNNPLPGITNADAMTAINLVYALAEKPKPKK